MSLSFVSLLCWLAQPRSFLFILFYVCFFSAIVCLTSKISIWFFFILICLLRLFILHLFQTCSLKHFIMAAVIPLSDNSRICVILVLASANFLSIIQVDIFLDLDIMSDFYTVSWKSCILFYVTVAFNWIFCFGSLLLHCPSRRLR